MKSYGNNIHNFARAGLSNGMNICKDATCGTIGAAGKNVIIRQEFYPYYISTKDAFSIIQSIKCNDPLEKQAVDMLRDATDSMNKIAKDGRTAMCLINDAILQTSAHLGANPIAIEKAINDLIPEIDKLIDDQTRECTVDMVEAVARTASNSDRIAKILGSVYKTQGKDCIVNYIEASGTLEDYVIFHDGVRFQGTGFLSDSFVHDPQAKKDKRTEKRAVYENPTILVTKNKIQVDADIAPLIDSLFAQGKKDLIIFTNDMDSSVATNLVNTHKAGQMNICIIKAPTLWPELVFEDFAKCVGATIVEDATGIRLGADLPLAALGTCAKIVIDKDETIINGGADISDHIAELKKAGDDNSLRRVWWLSAKTATIRLGATNEGELSNLRLAAQDAVFSSQAALQSGIVPGGGVALLNVSGMIKDPVLKKAFEAPARQIRKNAGLEEINYLYGPKDVMGLNALTLKDVDMFKAGIVDSALVVKNSVRNAIKIASIVLKTDKLIDIPEKTMQELQLEILGKQRGPFG